MVKDPSECKERYQKILGKLHVNEVFSAADLCRPINKLEYDKTLRAIKHAMEIGVIKDADIPNEFTQMSCSILKFHLLYLMM